MGQNTGQGIHTSALIFNLVMLVGYDAVRLLSAAKFKREPVQNFQSPILLAGMGEDEKYLPVFLFKSFPNNQLIGFGTEFPMNAVARVTRVIFPQIVFLGESTAVFRFEACFCVQDIVPVRNGFRRNRRRQNGAACLGRRLLPQREQTKRIPAFLADNTKAELTT